MGDSKSLHVVVLLIKSQRKCFGRVRRVDCYADTQHSHVLDKVLCVKQLPAGSDARQKFADARWHTFSVKTERRKACTHPKAMDTVDLFTGAVPSSSRRGSTMVRLSSMASTTPAFKHASAENV